MSEENCNQTENSCTDSEKSFLCDFRLHAENILTSRTNFFLVAQSFFVVAAATLAVGAQDSFLDILLLLVTLGGLLVSVVWFFLGFKIYDRLYLFDDIVKDFFPKYKIAMEQTEKCISSNKFIALLIPGFFAFGWFVAFLYVIDFFVLIEWDAISAIVLAITAVFIAVQTRATREMVKNQMRPSVDVSMVFDAQYSPDGPGTRLQFINLSQVPAVVWIRADLKIGGKRRNDLINNEYLKGNEIDVGSGGGLTNTGFFRNVTGEKEYVDKKIEVILRVDAAPRFNKKIKWESFQEIHYEFENRQWMRRPFWGVPDKIQWRLFLKDDLNKPT